MIRTFTSILLSLVTIAAISQPALLENAATVGIDHNAQLCDIDMPGQGGAAWFDYDQDGWYDLYVTGGCGRDALYHNDGGTFTDVTIAAGLQIMWGAETDGVTTGDINRDGYPDLFVSTFKTSPNFLFLNNGNGTFTQVQLGGQGEMANSFSAVFADLDIDGWLDLFVCNWSTDFEVTVDGNNVSVDAYQNYYYRNNGNGTFTERSSQAEIDDTLGCALGVLVTDIDYDNDPDLYVANDLGYFTGNSPNRLFRNQYPLEAFTEESNSLGLDLEMNGMGVAKGDVDLDGQFEFFLTNIGRDRLMVRGISGYEDQSVARGIKHDSVWVDDLSVKTTSIGWGAAFMDLDNDMDEDLMIANGSLGYGVQLPALDSNRLYLNDGTGNFTDISLQTGVADVYVSRALAYCDYNLDGKLDVFVGVTDEVDGSYKSMLYRNISPNQNWIQVQCRGINSNIDGIGTILRLYTNGVMQIREIGGESSFNSQHWNVAHFGLGSNEVIDSLEVYWPSGIIDVHYNPAINNFYGVFEGQGVVTGVGASNEATVAAYPNPFTNILTIDVKANTVYEIRDAKGALVMSFNGSGNGIKTIDTSTFATGSYSLISKEGSGKIVSRKLIKQ